MPFVFKDGQLCADDVPLSRIAGAVGTPTYVYCWADIETRYQELGRVLAGLNYRICYAVKANSNLSILARLAALGASFDIVSGGELERLLRAGGSAANVVFSGVGKSEVDIDFALKCGIGCFNVESASELERLAARAKLLGRRAPVSVRVNPDIDAATHPYIATGLKESKFGVPAPLALELYRRAASSAHLTVVGIDCHIGSQVTDPKPFETALGALLKLVDALASEGIALRHVDIGGGFGVSYDDAKPLDLAALGQALNARLADRDMELLVEPGRYLVAEDGVLLTRVEYLKPAATSDHRNFAIVDAAMNDLIRPALYQAWHKVDVVSPAETLARSWNVVGPVCESGDFLALDRELALAEGGLLAIGTAGAYGFVQSSNYNTRPRAAEVLVDGGEFAVARRRETVSDLIGLENIV